MMKKSRSLALKKKNKFPCMQLQLTARHAMQDAAALIDADSVAFANSKVQDLHRLLLASAVHHMQERVHMHWTTGRLAAAAPIMIMATRPHHTTCTASACSCCSCCVVDSGRQPQSKAKAD